MDHEENYFTLKKIRQITGLEDLHIVTQYEGIDPETRKPVRIAVRDRGLSSKERFTVEANRLVGNGDTLEQALKIVF